MLQSRNDATESLRVLKQKFGENLLQWANGKIDQSISKQQWHLAEKTAQIVSQISASLLTPDQNRELDSLIAKGRVAQAEAEFNRFHEKTLELLNQGLFRKAAEQLEQQPNDGRIEQYRKEFHKEVLRELDTQLKNSSKNWEAGYVSIEDVESIHLDSPDARAALSKLKENFYETHDRELYRPCQKSPSLDRCETYLSESKMKTMERAARRYVEYATQHNNQTNFNLKLTSIRSPKDYGEVKLEARLSDRAFSNIGNQGTLEIDEGNNSIHGYIEFTKKPSDRVSLTAKMTDIGMVWDEPLGSESRDLPVDSLRNYSLCLSHPKQESPVCLDFELEGLAEAPILPEWGAG
jgi:hypothetical protein